MYKGIIQDRVYQKELIKISRRMHQLNGLIAYKPDVTYTWCRWIGSRTGMEKCVTANSQSSPLRDFRVLMLLFIGLRVVVLVAHDLDGLRQYGELINFYRVAELTGETGLLPFVGYWVEYPPLFAWLNTGLYTLLFTVLGSPNHTYYYAWALISIAADCGNLVLIHRISSRLYGADRGLDIGWVYALLGVPLVFMAWNFELLTTLFMLLGLWWLISGRETESALAAAAGALTKVMPGLLVPVVWRFRSIPRAAKYTGIVVVLGVLAYLPWLIISPTFATASLYAQVGKSSWQTVWALIDGNFGTGNFGGVVERLDAATARVMVGNPPVIPGWVTLIVFGALYAYLFTRPMHQSDRSLVAFFGVTWCVFLLWAKGWSPQWMAMILPLMLLVFPDRQGILAILIFALINFIEWPLLLSRGLTQGLYLTVIMRTLFLIGLLAAFFRQCYSAQGEQFRLRLGED